MRNGTARSAATEAGWSNWPSSPAAGCTPPSGSSIRADDNAARMSLPGTEPPQPAAPPPGEATVTHLAPRMSTASGFGPAGMGNGAMATGPGNGLGSGGRARYDRPG